MSALSPVQSEYDEVVRAFGNDRAAGQRGTILVLSVGSAAVQTMSPKEYLIGLPQQKPGGEDFQALSLEEHKKTYLFAKALSTLCDASILTFAKAVGVSV